MYEPFTPDDMRARAVQARRAIAVLLVVAVGLPVVASVQPPLRRDDVLDLVVVWLVLVVWTLVTWLRWFHSVHDMAVARGRARFRGSWWLWAWLIPGVNLVLPKMMVDDLWRAGRPRASRRRPHPTVTLWWTCWTASTLAAFLRNDALLGPAAPLTAVYLGGSVAFVVLSLRVVEILTPHAVGLHAAHLASVEPPSAAMVQPVT